MAVAPASSKKLEAPINADGQAIACFSPAARLSQYASAELKNTWIRMGTANNAMTRGCCRMASPWNANSSTRGSSSAAMDQGPMRSEEHTSELQSQSNLEC